jgi:hypothetical protein
MPLNVPDRNGFRASLPPRGEPSGSDRVAQASGFSLHAGVAAGADQRGTLERLCRYIARPAVAIERLSLTAQGHIRYALKTPYRDGTTHVIFEPLDFLARLAALVPSPGVNLTRYHGVFAPNHRLRAQIVPAQRGRGGSAGPGQGSAVPKHAAMTWAQRLKRVFGIEIERCEQCGGAVKIIASIEDPQVIGRILEHLGLHGSHAHGQQLPPARAPRWNEVRPVRNRFRHWRARRSLRDRGQEVCARRRYYGSHGQECAGPAAIVHGPAADAPAWNFSRRQFHGFLVDSAPTWIRGRYKILVINLQQEPPSGRRKSLSVEEGSGAQTIDAHVIDGSTSENRRKRGGTPEADDGSR